MINSNLVTCFLCRSYYADPRQIPCAHSFCFDCLSGRFDDETFVLHCPKCDKLHQYQSREEFEHRCIPDGFLASMVTQFKRKQSRLSVVSRPSSSMSFMSSVYAPDMYSMYEPTDFLHSSRFQSFRPSSVLSSSNSRSFVAKCQSCNRRTELNVCQHCDNVLCFSCIDEHQTVLNEHVKNLWHNCQLEFQTIEQRSLQFDRDSQQCQDLARRYQRMINERGGNLIQVIEHQKNIYLHWIEKHRRNDHPSLPHDSLTQEFESIGQKIVETIRSGDRTSERTNVLLTEVEQFQTRVENLIKLVDTYELKFPILTLPEPSEMLNFFGMIGFVRLDSCSRSDSLLAEDYTQIPSNHLNRTISIPSVFSLANVPRKEILWDLEYTSVPYFIVLYVNRLFVADKYGFLSIYQLTKANDLREKPIFLHSIRLFGEPFDDRTFIDSFVVYSYGIIVIKRKKNDSFGTVFLFDHDGFNLTHHQYISTSPLHDLTMDFDTHLLWSLDEQQAGLFYCPLPSDQISLVSNSADLFHHRFLYMQFSKTTRLPKKFSITKDLVAVLDTSRQTIDVCDKTSRERLCQYTNHQNKSTHVCWSIGLLTNQTILIKLDNIESLKTGPSKHIYLHLDLFNPQEVMGVIEEKDVFGMLIGPNDEILLGSRMNTVGIIRCYV